MVHPYPKEQHLIPSYVARSVSAVLNVLHSPRLRLLAVCSADYKHTVTSTWRCRHANGCVHVQHGDGLLIRPLSVTIPTTASPAALLTCCSLAISILDGSKTSKDPTLPLAICMQVPLSFQIHKLYAWCSSLHISSTMQ